MINATWNAVISNPANIATANNVRSRNLQTGKERFVKYKRRDDRVKTKLNKVGHSRKSKHSALMTSQPRHVYLASQAVHVADDITNLHF